jgi:hypothetical protein
MNPGVGERKKNWIHILDPSVGNKKDWYYDHSEPRIRSLW